MEVILLGIYSFFVWLIFIKLKLLPWTTPWKVAVAIFPVVAIASCSCSSEHLRADDERRAGRQVRRADRVAGARDASSKCRSRTTGRSRRATCCSGSIRRRTRTKSTRSRRGCAADEAKVGADRERLGEVQAKLADAQSTEPQLQEQLNAATEQVASLSASLDAGAEARRAEHRARGRRRRQPVRSRAGADERQRADGADRRRARRRAADPRKARRPRQAATWRRSRRSRRRSPPPQAQVKVSRGAGRDDARAARDRALGADADDASSRRATARW